MNPIEHLWDEMERRLNKEIRPRSLEELKARLVNIWRSIELAVTEKLVNSMTARVGAVLKSRGGATCY